MPDSILIDHNGEKITIPTTLPLLPLRDMVVFPNMVCPLLLGRPFSIDALQEAMIGEKLVLLCTQKRPQVEEPTHEDLFSIGVAARILQVMKLPNQMVKVLVEGLVRARLVELVSGEHSFNAKLDFPATPLGVAEPQLEALSRQVSANFEEYVKLSHRIPDEVLLYLSNVDDYQKLADTISAHLEIKVKAKQAILEAASVFAEFQFLEKIFKHEIEILRIQEGIDNNVKESLLKSQREYYLQHQLRAIKEELGQLEDGGAEADQYYARLKKMKVSQTVRRKASEEIERLRKMHPFSAEAAVVRGYLDWLLGLPWGTYTKDNADFKAVSKMLDEDHFGLEKPKKRILEHLAVIALAGEVKGPILCLVGPPGVGKTSLGNSVARSLGRKFVRMSLGGLKDEAEIRGHRRTYIGSLPGRIIQSIKKAGSANPVFMLDEVDKIGIDFRGDPAAALLEVLDPEQNYAFVDNFLETEFDLSRTLFITTANTLQGIPAPLADRMEIIRLPGYLDFEKIHIAQQFLIPKLKRELGLSAIEIKVPESVLQAIVREYTREAGVRELERQLASIFRKIAQEVVSDGKQKEFSITTRSLRKYLGAPQYIELERSTENLVGRSYGLAWTETGGEILPVEVSLMNGKSQLNLTGKLGTVMKESAAAALSYIRSNALRLGLKKDFYKDLEIHLHIPEGAVPKDGPSAGIAILVALLSALSGKSVPADVALTGELTLTGQVLPVGGLNEKFIAARRARIKTVICPQKNEAEIQELPKDVTQGLELKSVKTAADVLALVFNSSKRHARSQKR